MSSEKRLLTPEEIDYILSDCFHRGLTQEQNAAVTATALKPIRDSLTTLEVYPQIIPTLKTEITRKYYRSRVEPGNCVGITQGQVLGENLTQAELNKFHQAGAGVVLLNGISGVQRFNEILVASSKPKGQLTSVYFKSAPRSIEKARRKVGTDIQQITVQNLTEPIPEYEYSETGFMENWYGPFEDFFEDFLPENFKFSDTRYRIKVCLDGHAFMKWGLTEISIARALGDIPGTVAIFSPTSMLEIHIFPMTQDFRETCWMSDIHQYYQTVLSAVIVAGIQHIEALHFKRIDTDSEDWMALCEGERLSRGNTVKTSVSRFIKILTLDYVDQFLTISNNIWDIVTVFGVESVRELMIYEFLACSDEVNGKNTRHVELLVDIMIYTGRIVAVSKNGVNPDTAQILLRASFEQVVPQFTTAAIHTEVDDVSSISAGMICGSICTVGTAINGLIMQPSV